MSSKSDILENIISASKNSNFHVVEDIYDSANNKLLAKGYKITPKIREQLLDRILKKPIETSIQSEASVTSNDLTTQALISIKSIPIIKLLKINLEIEANELKYLNLEPLASLLLSVIRDTKPKNINHLILVTLVARAIGRKMELSEYDMKNLSIACILHDIGQIYASIPDEEKLTEEGWRKVMVHPILGSSIIKTYMNYPSEVSAAVLEHHERCNGKGYPKFVDANECSLIGQVLILAEAIAGILKPGKEVQSVLVVLKLSTRDYPALPLNAFNKLIDTNISIRSESNINFTQDMLKESFQILNEMELKIQGLIEDDNDCKMSDVASNLHSRLVKLKQTLHASGITHYLEDDIWYGTLNDQVIRAELELTTYEIGWQLKDIVRDTALRQIDSSSIIAPKLLEFTTQLNEATRDLLKKMI